MLSLVYSLKWGEASINCFKLHDVDWYTIQNTSCIGSQADDPNNHPYNWDRH